MASAAGSVSPWLAKKAAAASPPKPVVWIEAMRPAFQSATLIQSRQGCSGVLQRVVSQSARPRWSGCMCVTRTRSTGRPSSSGDAKMRSQASRVASLVMPQSTIVQPARPSISSRSSQRLMWSSANGSPMRTQRTPGATSRVVPTAGSASPNA